MIVAKHDDKGSRTLANGDKLYLRSALCNRWRLTYISKNNHIYSEKIFTDYEAALLAYEDLE